TFYIAVMVTAWHGGLGPSLVALSLGLLSASYFFGPARDSFAVFGLEQQVGLALYLLVGLGTALLSEALRRERARADTDYLTGVGNARSFHQRLKVEIRRSKQSKRPFTVAYLDLDDFKEVNDRLGHHRGDILLRLVAVTVQTCIRKTDVLARLGG